MKKNYTNILVIACRLVSIVIIIFCLIYIYNWYMGNKKSADMLQTVTETAVIETNQLVVPINDTETTENTNNEWSKETTTITTYTLDFEKLNQINSSTVGWITVPGTTINYPVVQTGDNSFYLKHSFDKSYNQSGWIFADYRNKLDGTDKNLIIYGHNRMDSSMFATLKNTQKKDWFNNKNNHYITYTTPTETIVYQVFSVYTIKSETYYLTTYFKNDDTYLNFLNTLKNRSIFNFGVNLSAEDKILTLSTCDATGKSRMLVHAKRIL